MFPARGGRKSPYFVHGTKGPSAQASHTGWQPWALQKKLRCLTKGRTTMYFKTGHEPQFSLTAVVEYCVPTMQNVLLNCPLKSPRLEMQNTQMAIPNDSII